MLMNTKLIKFNKTEMQINCPLHSLLVLLLIGLFVGWLHCTFNYSGQRKKAAAGPIWSKLVAIKSLFKNLNSIYAVRSKLFLPLIETT